MNHIHCPRCGVDLGPATSRIETTEIRHDGIKVFFEPLVVLHRCEGKR